MTISKRQKVIIWGTVIIIILLLGLTSSQKTYAYKSTYNPNHERKVTVQLTHIFGIEVARKSAGTDDFFYYIVKNISSEIIIVALLGLTALITSKRK
jgi:hypothetical protein